MWLRSFADLWESQKRFEDNRGASEDYGNLRMLLVTDLVRERGLGLDYLQTVSSEERLAWRWALFNDKAIRDTQSTELCRIVRCKDVCNDSVALTKAVFAYVGLQTQKMIHQSTAQDSDSFCSVFKDSKKAAGKRCEELDPQCTERILAITRGTVPGSMFLEMDIETHLR